MELLKEKQSLKNKQNMTKKDVQLQGDGENLAGYHANIWEIRQLYYGTQINDER